MPRMNGWEFLDAYRSIHNEQKYKTIIVMLTTSENPDDRAKAHTIYEINEFLIKPLDEEKLRALLRKYFEEKL
jgi:CheY-like chemotaxis protein